MNRYHILLWTMTFLAINVTGQQRPNIVVIFSDDHTQQTISAYGSKLMQTPGIDRIAYEGVIMMNSFVTNSLCAPSRAAFLTGKYSHLNGLKDNSPDRLFDGSQQQVQKILQHNGYQTAWIGKWHLQTLPQGFDFWTVLPDQGNYFEPDFINMKNDTIRHSGYVSNIISDFSLGWLDKRDRSKPFFLVVGEKATHRNWMPDLQDLGAFDSVQFHMPANFYDTYKGRRAAAEQDMTIDKTLTIDYDLKIGANYNEPGLFGRMTPNQKAAYKNYYEQIGKEYEQVKNNPKRLVKWKYQRYMNDYLSTARSMDRNITRILKYLDENGLAQNTIVIYTSDQGFYMGEHGWFDKRFMYEESFRTPFVMRYPGKIPPASVATQMTMNIDLAPTLLEFSGIPVPSDMQGKSFAKIVTGNQTDSSSWRRSVYYHYYEYPQPHKVPAHFGIRTQRYKLIRFYGPFNAWELYDLDADRSEMQNLYGKPGYEKITAQLMKELIDLAAQYQDEEALEMMQEKKMHAF